MQESVITIYDKFVIASAELATVYTDLSNIDTIPDEKLYMFRELLDKQLARAYATLTL